MPVIGGFKGCMHKVNLHNGAALAVHFNKISGFKAVGEQNDYSSRDASERILERQRYRHDSARKRRKKSGSRNTERIERRKDNNYMQSYIYRFDKKLLE